MDQLFHEFVQFCKDHIGASSESILKLVIKRYRECSSEFRQCDQFAELLQSTEIHIREDPSRFFVHLRDFLTILKANKGKKRTANWDSCAEGTGTDSDSNVHMSCDVDSSDRLKAKRRKIKHSDRDSSVSEVENEGDTDASEKSSKLQVTARESNKKDDSESEDITGGIPEVVSDSNEEIRDIDSQASDNVDYVVGSGNLAGDETEHSEGEKDEENEPRVTSDQLSQDEEVNDEHKVNAVFLESQSSVIEVTDSQTTENDSETDTKEICGAGALDLKDHEENTFNLEDMENVQGEIDSDKEGAPEVTDSKSSSVALQDSQEDIFNDRDSPIECSNNNHVDVNDFDEDSLPDIDVKLPINEQKIIKGNECDENVIEPDECIDQHSKDLDLPETPEDDFIDSDKEIEAIDKTSEDNQNEKKTDHGIRGNLVSKHIDLEQGSSKFTEVDENAKIALGKCDEIYSESKMEVIHDDNDDDRVSSEFLATRITDETVDFTGNITDQETSDSEILTYVSVNDSEKHNTKINRKNEVDAVNTQKVSSNTPSPEQTGSLSTSVTRPLHVDTDAKYGVTLIPSDSEDDTKHKKIKITKSPITSPIIISPDVKEEKCGFSCRKDENLDSPITSAKEDDSDSEHNTSIARRSLKFPYSTDDEEDDPEYVKKVKKFKEKKKKYKVSVGKRDKATHAKAVEASSSNSKRPKFSERRSYGLSPKHRERRNSGHKSGLSPKDKDVSKKHAANSPRKKSKSPKKMEVIILTESESGSDMEDFNLKLKRKRFEEDERIRKKFKIGTNPKVLVPILPVKLEAESEESGMESKHNLPKLLDESVDEATVIEQLNTGTENPSSDIDSQSKNKLAESVKRVQLTTLQLFESDKPSVESNVSVLSVGKEKFKSKDTEKIAEKSKDRISDGDSQDEFDAFKDKLERVEPERDEGSSREPRAGPSSESANKDNEKSDKKKKGSARQIRKLEGLLQAISNQIEKIRSRELSLDDLESETSDYILEDKLQKKFVKVWKKLCQLHNAAEYTGRPTEKYFRYQGTRYPDVNRKIEKFVNKRKMFPDYNDVRDLVAKVNKDKRLNLRPRDIDYLAREAFTDVGNQLQKRRQKDFFGSLSIPGSDMKSFSMYDDPALLDTDLKKKLESNKKVAKSKMTQVVEKFAHLQHEKGDKTDSGSGDDDDDDEEVDDDEAAAVEPLLNIPVDTSDVDDDVDDVDDYDDRATVNSLEEAARSRESRPSSPLTESSPTDPQSSHFSSVLGLKRTHASSSDDLETMGVDMGVESTENSDVPVTQQGVISTNTQDVESVMETSGNCNLEDKSQDIGENNSNLDKVLRKSKNEALPELSETIDKRADKINDSQDEINITILSDNDDDGDDHLTDADVAPVKVRIENALESDRSKSFDDSTLNIRGSESSGSDPSLASSPVEMTRIRTPSITIMTDEEEFLSKSPNNIASSEYNGLSEENACNKLLEPDYNTDGSGNESTELTKQVDNLVAIIHTDKEMAEKLSTDIVVDEVLDWNDCKATVDKSSKQAADIDTSENDQVDTLIDTVHEHNENIRKQIDSGQEKTDQNVENVKQNTEKSDIESMEKVESKAVENVLRREDSEVSVTVITDDEDESPLPLKIESARHVSLEDLSSLHQTGTTSESDTSTSGGNQSKGKTSVSSSQKPSPDQAEVTFASDISPIKPVEGDMRKRSSGNELSPNFRKALNKAGLTSIHAGMSSTPMPKTGIHQTANKPKCSPPPGQFKVTSMQSLQGVKTDLNKPMIKGSQFGTKKMNPLSSMPRSIGRDVTQNVLHANGKFSVSGQPRPTPSGLPVPRKYPGSQPLGKAAPGGKHVTSAESKLKTTEVKSLSKFSWETSVFTISKDKVSEITGLGKTAKSPDITNTTSSPGSAPFSSPTGLEISKFSTKPMKISAMASSITVKSGNSLNKNAAFQRPQTVQSLQGNRLVPRASPVSAASAAPMKPALAGKPMMRPAGSGPQQRFKPPNSNINRGGIQPSIPGQIKSTSAAGSFQVKPLSNLSSGGKMSPSNKPIQAGFSSRNATNSMAKQKVFTSQGSMKSSLQLGNLFPRKPMSGVGQFRPGGGKIPVANLRNQVSTGSRPLGQFKTSGSSNLEGQGKNWTVTTVCNKSFKPGIQTMAKSSPVAIKSTDSDVIVIDGDQSPAKQKLSLPQSTSCQQGKAGIKTINVKPSCSSAHSSSEPSSVKLNKPDEVIILDDDSPCKPNFKPRTTSDNEPHESRNKTSDLNSRERTDKSSAELKFDSNTTVNNQSVCSTKSAMEKASFIKTDNNKRNIISKACLDKKAGAESESTSSSMSSTPTQNLRNSNTNSDVESVSLDSASERLPSIPDIFAGPESLEDGSDNNEEPIARCEAREIFQDIQPSAPTYSSSQSSDSQNTVVVEKNHVSSDSSYRSPKKTVVVELLHSELSDASNRLSPSKVNATLGTEASNGSVSELTDHCGSTTHLIGQSSTYSDEEISSTSCDVKKSKGQTSQTVRTIPVQASSIAGRVETIKQPAHSNEVDSREGGGDGKRAYASSIDVASDGSARRRRTKEPLWTPDANASLIDTYQEPDSTPYQLEDNTISSSGQKVIVLSDSD